MPGKVWSRRELRTAKKLRKNGLSVNKMVSSGMLPGRSRQAIDSFFSRQNLVDPLKSERIRKSRTNAMNEEQRNVFTAFLADYGFLVYSQIAQLWKRAYVAQGCPPVSATTIGRWLRKLNLHRNRKVALRTPYSRAKRRRIAAARKRARDQRHARQAAEELAAQRKRKEAYIKRHPTARLPCCLACRERWPETTDFFNQLAPFFAPAGGRLRRLQTGICRVCLKSMQRKRTAARADGKGADSHVEIRDKLWEEALDFIAEQNRHAQLHERDQSLRSDPHQPCANCARCGEPFPLDSRWFKPNPQRPSGRRTFRAICRLCENDFARQIGRLKRRGKTWRHVTAERRRCLAHGSPRRAPRPPLASSA